MAEYIERKELLKTIDEVITKCESAIPATPAQVHELAGETNATKAIRFLIRNFDAADVRENRWISVKERLPEKPGIYAVWTAKGFGNHLSASNWDGESWSLRVTHWMPLPEPPKEDNT